MEVSSILLKPIEVFFSSFISILSIALKKEV